MRLTRSDCSTSLGPELPLSPMWPVPNNPHTRYPCLLFTPCIHSIYTYWMVSPGYDVLTVCGVIWRTIGSNSLGQTPASSKDPTSQCFKDLIFAKSQHVCCDTSPNLHPLRHARTTSVFPGNPLYLCHTPPGRQTCLSGTYLLQHLHIWDSRTTGPLPQALLQPLSVSKARLSSHALITVSWTTSSAKQTPLSCLTWKRQKRSSMK